MNGLIWVIVIFVLQAVIAGLAKRAQQNAQQKPQQMPKEWQGGAQPTAGELSDMTRGDMTRGDMTEPVRAAKAPKVAGTSTVVVKRPTSIVTGKRFATSTTKTPTAKTPTTKTVTGAQRSSTGASGKPVATPPTSPARSASTASTPATPPKVTPPRVIVRAEAPEEADAMASRAKVAASVARIRSVESSVSSSHVTGLGQNLGKTIKAAEPVGSGAAARRDALTPSAIAQSLRNPQRIREAIILSEVLGTPRGMR
ncbi:MAG: hypothetical protein RIR10_98 [Planctomycetota bacterium]|jgi:hypothetical protein